MPTALILELKLSADPETQLFENGMTIVDIDPF